jgi:hypothetical protein
MTMNGHFLLHSSKSSPSQKMMGAPYNCHRSLGELSPPTEKAIRDFLLELDSIELYP